MQAQPSRVSLGSNFPASHIIGAPLALADGLLLGGWFSYDPEGDADDADAQH